MGAGEFGESVEPGGESLGGVRGGVRRPRLPGGPFAPGFPRDGSGPGSLAGRGGPRSPGGRTGPGLFGTGRSDRPVGADAGGELAEGGLEAAAFAAAVAAPVVVGGPERGGAHLADVGREGQPAGGLVAGVLAEGVDVELVRGEAAYEPVAPKPGLTRGVRIATFREQSDPHVHTPDLPCRRPPFGPVTRSGKNVSGYAGGAMDGCPSRHRKG